MVDGKQTVFPFTFTAAGASPKLLEIEIGYRLASDSSMTHPLRGFFWVTSRTLAGCVDPPTPPPLQEVRRTPTVSFRGQ